MRADRLVATLLVLQATGRVTAAEVAEELEVSVKTARRDLEALAMAGIPVYSQAGKGGGWSLIGGARTDLSGLTAAEARTLFMVAGPSSTATPEAKAALRKLVQALPETFRADAEAAASAVVLDPAGWGGSTTPRPPHLDELQRAVVEGARCASATPTGRVPRPSARSTRSGSSRRASVWYLVADTANGHAHVPPQPGALGRPSPTIPSCARRTSTSPRPGARWSRRSRSGAPWPRPSCASIRRWLPGLRAQFASSFTVLGEAGDGRLDVEIGAPQVEHDRRAARRLGRPARGRQPRRGPRRPRPHRPRARRALRGDS